MVYEERTSKSINEIEVLIRNSKNESTQIEIALKNDFEELQAT